MLMSDTGNNCQGCGTPYNPGTLFCPGCGLPVAAASRASGPDSRTIPAPGKGRPPAGDAAPGGSPQWRPGQDWSPGAEQQEQQVPWWPTPPQPGQQTFNQQGFNQQGYGPQGYGPQGTGPAPIGGHGFSPTSPQLPPGRGQRPSRLPVIAVTIAVAALLGSGAGAYVLIARPFSSPASTTASGTNAANVSQSTSAPATPGSAASAQSSSTAPVTPPASQGSQNTSVQQAATALAGLLQQSSGDRSAINDAYNDAYSCGGNLTSDQRTFQQAASSRQSLLSQLSSLPGAHALPAQMLSDLTNAWQASLSVDNDYAQWAGDESSSGCTLQDPGYTAAETPNEEATTDKNAFVSQWDPIAQRYNLTQYSGGQI
jgi:hypothetical protein